MRQRVTYIAIIAVLIAASIGTYVVRRSDASQPKVSTTTTTAPKLTGFYLDIGASDSLGYQPTGIVNHNGRRTDTGYANDLLFLEKLKGADFTLNQIGCPGETVQSMAGLTVNKNCYNLPETQMSNALRILQANKSETGIVTIDLGFNNIRICMAPTGVNEACAAAAVAAIGADMPKIVKELKAGAGANVHFVGIEYNDPFLAYYLDGSNGPAVATQSLVAIDSVDAALVKAYTAANIPVANVPGMFQTNDSTRVVVSNVGTIPFNVEEACELTWMCYPTPFGPDDHPNDAGYSFIAQAIEAELPKSW
jgi:lysophospholipase L1-like esterase